MNLAAPCSAGSYMTESGCQQCGMNSFSGPGASSCTSCPDDKIAPAGSTSEDDCYYGTNTKFFQKFNTYFTSVSPTAMWLRCNRPITGAE